ncbi:class I SAM-dependent methyltransferase [Roseococcus sp. SDR]|uniref:class I SAM-dependent methyltransferase n=1 Tax=Roseococcus sp. SDR TaxID=2835532 RepID=UPI001BCF4258|nr:class I SAM-dependent methyltransferase [Roseococcus sp. SDR]MBS7791923.1 class I SAM-dependent methyltransferase [Roseococcus sp. SDR]MBV1847237.1 class I SAM-dependent methyltransferase [Roseococcus sp. SDR]
MINSAEYWEKRYSRGKNSGAGSYGQLARFKADVINRVIAETKAGSVMDFGCGDGNQLSLMTPVPYVGVDVSRTVLAALRERFAAQPLYRFLHADELPGDLRCDITLSCDVLYHLVEDQVFENYMLGLFHHARNVVVIYSSDHEEPYAGSHIRHRRFTDFIAARLPGWRRVLHIPNPYPWDTANRAGTSFADFHIFAAPPEAAGG